MADLDYGALQIYPGNYDEYMAAATQARQRLLSDNAKKKAQIAQLQSFVARFSANASKARQATSRAKQMDKIKLAEVKPSSRQNPFIRFEQEKKLHRLALEMENVTQGYVGEEPLFKDLNLMVEAGERIAVIGPNGIGKTTLVKTLAKQMEQQSGKIKWAEAADIGYFAQDHTDDFADDVNLYDWILQWRQEGDDEQVLRGALGRMLFSAEDIKKSVKVISGGEQGRLLFAKLSMLRTNVLIMDEPTNHLDMESIESLNYALENYEGTLIFVSHDREFVSSLATRVIEMTSAGLVDYHGSYDEYLRSQGLAG